MVIIIILKQKIKENKKKTNIINQTYNTLNQIQSYLSLF